MEDKKIRGGKRANSGRKKNNNETIFLQFDKDLYEQLKVKTPDWRKKVQQFILKKLL